MKTSTFVALGLAFCLQNINIADAQQSAPLKAKTQFVLSPNTTENDYIPKTVIFKLKSQYRSLASPGYVNNSNLQLVLNYLGVDKFGKKFPRHRAPEFEFNSLGQAYADLSLIYELKYTKNIPITQAINQMLATGIMEFAEPSYVYQVHDFTPNDPSFGQQKAFFDRIRAQSAWDLALGGSRGDTSVVIAIVDSGTDLDHPDLVANFKRNYADPVNGLDDDQDGYIDNYTGYDLAGGDWKNLTPDNDPNIKGGNNDHGSHVSGCAAATTNNSTGVAGIGFNCKILPIKCAADNDNRGSSGEGYIVAGYDGITYAADHGAKIINCSWGGLSGSAFGQTVIDYATINKNCLVVASAGNTNKDEKNYPASYNYVLSVGATNSSNDRKANFSTYNYSVDISTPGVNIYSTVYNNTYTSKNGTSMASPITAGAAGLIQAKFKYTNALQIGERLKQTSDNMYVAGPNIISPTTPSLYPAFQNKLGKGRMNVYRALTDGPTPAVSLVSKIVDDHNDHAIVVGDSLFISGNFLNYLDPTSSALSGTLSVVSGSQFVTAIDSTSNIGAIGTLATANNNADPFIYKVNSGTPLNSVITFQLTLNDTAYTEKFFFDVTVNVDYINVNVNEVATTITSKGNIGFNEERLTGGLGFIYQDKNLLYEAGLMIGTSTSAVSDHVRGSIGGTQDTDFVSVSNVNRVIPSVRSEFDLSGTFNDSWGSPIQNLLVTHKTYAWSTVGSRKFVIVEYDIKNTGSTALNNLYAGIFADWDIDSAATNKADYDPIYRMGYTYNTKSGGKYAAVQQLSSTGWYNGYSIDHVDGGAGGVDLTDTSANSRYYSTSKKYITLSASRYKAGEGSATGNDVFSVVSSGPHSITAGSSVKVAFALIAGDNLADLKKSADTAQFRYDGTKVGIRNNAVNQIQTAVYPNPTNSDLSFVFDGLNNNEQAVIIITNTLGQAVKTVSQSNTTPGYNKITTNVSDLPEGTYFYQLNLGDKTTVGKFVISQ